MQYTQIRIKQILGIHILEDLNFEEIHNRFCIPTPISKKKITEDNQQNRYKLKLFSAWSQKIYCYEDVSDIYEYKKNPTASPDKTLNTSSTGWVQLQVKKQ